MFAARWLLEIMNDLRSQVTHCTPSLNWLILWLIPRNCEHRLCISVYVCPLAYLKNHVHFQKIFYSSNLCLRLGRCRKCSILCTSGFVVTHIFIQWNTELTSYNSNTESGMNDVPDEVCYPRLLWLSYEVFVSFHFILLYLLFIRCIRWRRKAVKDWAV